MHHVSLVSFGVVLCPAVVQMIDNGGSSDDGPDHAQLGIGQDDLGLVQGVFDCAEEFLGVFGVGDEVVQELCFFKLDYGMIVSERAESG